MTVHHEGNNALPNGDEQLLPIVMLLSQGLLKLLTAYRVMPSSDPQLMFRSNRVQVEVSTPCEKSNRETHGTAFAKTAKPGVITLQPLFAS